MAVAKVAPGPQPPLPLHPQQPPPPLLMASSFLPHTAPQPPTAWPALSLDKLQAPHSELQSLSHWS